MDLIKVLSSRVEREQTKKLQELGSGSLGERTPQNDDFMSFGAINDTKGLNGNSADEEDDFEKLVLGKANGNSKASWNTEASTSQRPTQAPSSNAPVFSWSTPSNLGIPQQSNSSRTVTPDLTSFTPLAPSSNHRTAPLSPPLQPGNSSSMSPMASLQASTNLPSLQNAWSTQRASSNPSISSLNDLNRSTPGMSIGQTTRPMDNSIAFGIPPPPSSNSSYSTQPVQYTSNTGTNPWAVPPPPPGPGLPQTQTSSPGGRPSPNTAKTGTQPRSGLDAYQSLL